MIFAAPLRRTLQGALLLLGALCVDAGAHEFWMLPNTFNPAPGTVAGFALSVGQDFIGDPVPFSRPLVADLRHLALGVNADLRPLASGPGSSSLLRVRMASPGTHVVALDTHPSFIELPAEKFNDYLRLEGLQAVLKAREQAGTSDTPGRERYRRNVKTVVQATAPVDGTLSRRTGQRLEIVPVLAAGAGLLPSEPLSLQVWFDDRPLVGALVKLWHGSGASLVTLQAVTDAQGRVALTPSQPGTWMASVVHMIAVRDTAGIDWDSYWGNLTFALPTLPAQEPDVSTVPRR